MNTISHLAAVIGLTTTCVLVSCGSSPKQHTPDLRQQQMQAHVMREQVHREQVARQFVPLPEPEVPEPPTQVRYYEVPVEAHVNEDGLFIEAHNLTLEIVQ